MTSISVAYRHSGHFRPLFLKNPAIEETASAVRAQLVAEDTDRLPISTLREISRLNVNGLCFDLWVSLDHPVTDHETGEQVCGLCEFDPGAGEDAVSLLVSPVGEGMTEELVLSTFGHELGHAVFDAPGWIADSKVAPGLFDTPGQTHRQSAHDVRIIEAVARAMYWHNLLDSGTFKSVVEIARAEGLMPTTVGRLLRLARLAPDIVEQFMRGCQPRRLTLLWLMRNDIPALWPDQRQMLERFR